MFAHECNTKKCKKGCEEQIEFVDTDDEGNMIVVERDAVAEAKALCFTCPVIGQCNAWAWSGSHDSEAIQGVVAGTTEIERIQIRRRLRSSTNG